MMYRWIGVLPQVVCTCSDSLHQQCCNKPLSWQKAEAAVNICKFYFCDLIKSLTRYAMTLAVV